MTYYRCLVYVGENGLLMRTQDTGGQDFDTIYRRRPPRCRYVVCADWSFVTRSRNIVVFDLFDAQEEHSPTMRMVDTKPGRHWFYPDQDTAIAATILSYGGE